MRICHRLIWAYQEVYCAVVTRRACSQVCAAFSCREPTAAVEMPVVPVSQSPRFAR
ncbi:hypothetical protein C8T65DRAFT_644270, partial [Cerioporus squamosus]